MTEINRDIKSVLQKNFNLTPIFGDKAKEAFYNEFFSLIQSGIDIQRSLFLICEEEQNKTRKEVLKTILDNVVIGNSLAESLEKSKCFISYEFKSIQIGEETGRLKEVLVHLNKFYRDKVKLKRQLINVFTYPLFVLVITFAVLYFMLTNVVPMFKDVFKQFGHELPSLTQNILILSEHFTTILFFVIVTLIALSILAFNYRKEERFRRVFSEFTLRIPLFGNLLAKIYLTRFCQSMSLLLSAKTPLLHSLELTKEMVSFYPIEQAIIQMKDGIKKGDSLNEVMSRHSIFTNKMVSLTKIAEEINQLDSTYARIGETYQEEIEHQTKLIGTIMEPAIIVVIGGVVGLIMISMYMPMFELSNVVK